MLAMEELQDAINIQLNAYLDPVIAAGDFNQRNPKSVMPKLHKNVQWDNNILDQFSPKLLELISLFYPHT